MDENKGVIKMNIKFEWKGDSQDQKGKAVYSFLNDSGIEISRYELWLPDFKLANHIYLVIDSVFNTGVDIGRRELKTDIIKLLNNKNNSDG